MAYRPWLAFVLVGALASLGASYPTPNFIVEAPDAAFAKQVGDWAEHYRKQKAMDWLGQEMPTWGRPCPLRITITPRGSGGATEFDFAGGSIRSINMHIEGSPDRLVASVLPHEITHTVLAYYFRSPVPRWADEGGSVLSEDEQERNMHEQVIRQVLYTPGRTIPLRRLFSLKQYPPDVMVLYAEGYSVTNFLISQSSRQVFLAFLTQGMQNDWSNWDAAVRTHYRYRNVEDLEAAWIQHVRAGRQQMQLASNRTSGEASAAASRVVVRQTAPPAQPRLEAPEPIYRGQIPEEPARPRSDPRTNYALPPPPAVRLGAPEYDAAPTSMPQLGARSPQGWSR